jgi:hypothetical protein
MPSIAAEVMLRPAVIIIPLVGKPESASGPNLSSPFSFVSNSETFKEQFRSWEPGRRHCGCGKSIRAQRVCSLICIQFKDLQGTYDDQRNKARFEVGPHAPEPIPKAEEHDTIIDLTLDDNAQMAADAVSLLFSPEAIAFLSSHMWGSRNVSMSCQS